MLHGLFTVIHFMMKNPHTTSVNSTAVWIWSWLFCMIHFPCSVSFWRMHAWSRCGDLNKAFDQFIEGQTHFVMPRGAKIRLAPNEVIQNSPSQTSTTIYSKHALTKHDLPTTQSYVCKLSNSPPKLRLIWRSNATTSTAYWSGSNLWEKLSKQVQL